MTIHEKLLAVQTALNVPKKNYNSFSNFYYRTLEDVMEAVKPELKKVGASLTVGDDLVQIGDRYYVKAVARFTDIETGESVENVAFAREPESKKGMDESQISGTASTYARKYALNGLFCLDDVQDVDSMDNSAPKAKGKKADTKAEPAPAEKLEKKYISSLEAELNRTGVSRKSMLQTYRAKDIADLSFEQYKDAMSVLEKKPNAPAPVEPEYVEPDDSDLPWNQ